MQQADRRGLLYLNILVLIMLETLRRFTHLIAYSPLSMLGVELLALLLIAYQVGLGHRRRSVVKRRLKVLHGRMEKGRELRESAPQHNAPQHRHRLLEAVRQILD